MPLAEPIEKTYWGRSRDDWFTCMGPCMMTFGLPLTIPGVTLTLVPFGEHNGPEKFGALHILGFFILVVSILLLITGFLLCCIHRPKIYPADKLLPSVINIRKDAGNMFMGSDSCFGSSPWSSQNHSRIFSATHIKPIDKNNVLSPHKLHNNISKMDALTSSGSTMTSSSAYSSNSGSTYSDTNSSSRTGSCTSSCRPISSNKNSNESNTTPKSIMKHKVLDGTAKSKIPVRIKENDNDSGGTES